MPPNTIGVAMGTICWPSNGIKGEPWETGAINEAEVTDCFGRLGFQSVEANCAKENARGSLGPCRLSALPFSKRSIICLIGVMPAIGSLEKGKLNAIAPTNLLSM